MQRPGAAAILLAACCALNGCAGSGPEEAAPPRPSCKPPDQPTISFSANIQPFYNRSCAVGGCHVGPVPAQQLDLSVGNAYGDTVGVRATEVRQQLIDPGKPDDSYLLRKVQNAPGILNDPMPPPGCPTPPNNGAACPSQSDIDALSQWITECAPNN